MSQREKECATSRNRSRNDSFAGDAVGIDEMLLWAENFSLLGNVDLIFSVKIFLTRSKNKFQIFFLSKFARISNLKPAGRAEGKPM